MVEISKKAQKQQLLWYGHEMRREYDKIGRKMLDMQIEGQRYKRKPKRRWNDCIADDLKERGRYKR